jgi:hypothetical protein
LSKIIPLFIEAISREHKITGPLQILIHLEKFYEKLILSRIWSNHRHAFPPQQCTDTATTTIFALINRLMKKILQI